MSTAQFCGGASDLTYVQQFYRNVSLSSGVNVSYIEAGSSSSPTILLLHGFPSSSNQYRNLITLLAPLYHVIAPDLPGYGQTTVPADFVFTFANLTTVIAAFLLALNITSYAAYIFDFGAAVALRLALQDPHPIKAIISQNGNAYLEGLGHPFWDPVEALWNSKNGSTEREAIRTAYLNLPATKSQYTVGVAPSDLDKIDPAAYNYDYLQQLGTTAKQDVQLDLLYDYRTNLPLYPEFQKYFRKSQVPLLAVWGKGDFIFVPAGAEAFKRDLPNAEIKFVEAGHFALEPKLEQIGGDIKKFLKEIKY